ncbi:hypothetical protein CHS0354_015346 [Potamilus streckersoni]|uniref:Uncharacterized protein n=1 Tax=Potamilus streckersoni TaxID=2493646 RepID=A0AAE0VM28_9BIVA|nr:hypothetical protein CHS0354_015346 [Potamilus streckersoni]
MTGSVNSISPSKSAVEELSLNIIHTLKSDGRYWSVDSIELIEDCSSSSWSVHSRYGYILIVVCRFYMAMSLAKMSFLSFLPSAGHINIFQMGMVSVQAKLNLT